jgi:hypothetical protein
MSLLNWLITGTTVQQCWVMATKALNRHCDSELCDGLRYHCIIMISLLSLDPSHRCDNVALFSGPNAGCILRIYVGQPLKSSGWLKVHRVTGDCLPGTTAPCDLPVTDSVYIHAYSLFKFTIDVGAQATLRLGCFMKFILTAGPVLAHMISTPSRVLRWVVNVQMRRG